MTDSIHVASWTTTPSDTQTTIRQQKYANLKTYLESDTLRLRNKLLSFN